ncbi:MAG TPA: response regulator [Planctomycetota bacterium]
MTRTLLIADDEPAIRRLLVQALEGPGRRFLLAENGKAALAAWARGGVAVLILDQIMPGPTGLEVVRHIRQAGDAAPALLVSGALNADVVAAAGSLGGVECVSKPFALARLRAIVTRVLARVPARRDLRLGSLAVQWGLLTPEQVKAALDAQSREPLPIGRICLSRGYLSADQVETLLERQKELIRGSG